MNLNKLSNFRKNFTPILLTIFIGLFVRLLVSNWFGHVDLLSIAYWGEWMSRFGTGNFYSNEVWVYSWPTQLPIANLLYGFTFEVYQFLNWLFAHIAWIIGTYRLVPTLFLWWFDFVKWFGGDLYGETGLHSGHILTIKLLAIFADIAISLIIYLLARKYFQKKAYFFSAAYLFSPFSFYLSALWGQYDQIGFLLVIIAFLVFFQKKIQFLAPFLYFLSINIKPTYLIFLPVFILLLFKKYVHKIQISIGMVMVILCFIYSTALFTDKNSIDFLQNDLVGKVFFKAEFKVSVTAFNLWYALVGVKALNHNVMFLLLPAKIWGYTIFLYLNCIAILFLRKFTLERLVTVLYIISSGSFLFLTNMLERYHFAGVVSLLMLCVFKQNLFKYWLVISAIFWINLYNNWWQPEIFTPFQSLLLWNDHLLPRVLSIVNVLIFVRVLAILKLYNLFSLLKSNTIR